MKKNNILSAFIAITFLSGCAADQAPYHYRPEIIYSDAPPPPVITNSAPPAPQAEVVGEPPVRGYIWISGVWLWEGDHYVWRAGRWMAPRPGYTWIPHRWHQVGFEWQMDGGHWQRH